MNFFIKQMMGSLNFQEFGKDRKFYNQSQTAEVDVLGGDFTLEIMKGFKTAVEFYQAGPKVLIDCTRRIIRAYDMLAEMKFFINDRGMDKRQVLDEYVLDRIFMTTYGNNKMYKIVDVDATKTPLSAFPDQTKAKTYKEYFKKQYNIDIKDNTQNLVVAEVTQRAVNEQGEKIKVVERIHLVPELLKPTGLTDEIRNDRDAMRSIAGHTQVKPDKREEAQRGLGDKINGLSAAVNYLDFKIDTQSNVINDALNFTPPTILWRDAVNPREDGTFIGARSKVLQKQATLGKWAIVYDKDRVDDAKKSLTAMNNACRAIDVTVPDPVKIGVSFFNQQTKKPLNKSEKIKAIIEKLSKADNDITIFFFFFDKKKIADQVYDSVKDYCQKSLGK